jgi:hypothetical protein
MMIFRNFDKNTNKKKVITNIKQGILNIESGDSSNVELKLPQISLIFAEIIFKTILKSVWF